MTSNERKIIKCLWDAKGKAHIQLIARETGLSRDYARMLGRSLERAGYIKFAGMSLCSLLTKGNACFQDTAHVLDGSPEVVVASVATPAISVGDDIADDIAPKEAEDLPTASPADAADNSDFDKALAEVGVSYPFQIQKDEEASEKNEEILKAETIPQNIEEPGPAVNSESPTGGGETRDRDIEPQAVTETEPKEPEIIHIAEEKIMPVSVASSESPDKVAPKEASAKPGDSFGWSFQKIVNWFAEKK